MNESLHRNYLRTCRRKLGLTQDHLALLVGHETGSRISALENGRMLPTVAETVSFEVLFGRSFTELWPTTAVAFEAETHVRLKNLLAQVAASHHRSHRKRQRTAFIETQLRAIGSKVSETARSSTL